MYNFNMALENYLEGAAKILKREFFLDFLFRVQSCSNQKKKLGTVQSFSNAI